MAEAAAEGRVTPLAGVWIETSIMILWQAIVIVTPLAGVWIETDYRWGGGVRDESHPSRVCGLKRIPELDHTDWAGSHPSRVCGLKHPGCRHIHCRPCHTPRGCVD